MIVPTVQLTSDQQIFWQYGFVKLNETIVTTWAMMIAMTLGSFLAVSYTHLDVYKRQVP